VKLGPQKTISHGKCSATDFAASNNPALNPEDTLSELSSFAFVVPSLESVLQSEKVKSEIDLSYLATKESDPTSKFVIVEGKLQCVSDSPSNRPVPFSKSTRTSEIVLHGVPSPAARTPPRKTIKTKTYLKSERKIEWDSDGWSTEGDGEDVPGPATEMEAAIETSPRQTNHFGVRPPVTKFIPPKMFVASKSTPRYNPRESKTPESANKFVQCGNKAGIGTIASLTIPCRCSHSSHNISPPSFPKGRVNNPQTQKIQDIVQNGGPTTASVLKLDRIVEEFDSFSRGGKPKLKQLGRKYPVFSRYRWVQMFKSSPYCFCGKPCAQFKGIVPVYVCGMFSNGNEYNPSR
jgi:hypothetical protein